MIEKRLLRVHQWLPEWDEIRFDPTRRQSRPPKHFYLGSMRAVDLRRLADVAHRQSSPLIPGSAEMGIQRGLQSSRVDEITRYVRNGYPMSTLRGARLRDAEPTLRKPGWLASSIIVNVLPPGAQRDDRRLHEDDAVVIVDGGDRDPILRYPESWTDDWVPLVRAPIEVIDGQHRLWAFSGQEEYENYEVPVVLFYDLDLAWQAYLFWTVNIKPKRISPSLAYDLYPLLRDQEWLEAGEGLAVYRETRAQEITEALYSYPYSAWFGRVNMLGGADSQNLAPVTQAAFVRGLVTSFVKPWRNTPARPGGLFGGAEDGAGLNWNRLQQVALVLDLWIGLRDEIEAKAVPGAITSFLSSSDQPSLLATDQGVRCVLQTTNDVLRFRDDPELRGWKVDFIDESFSIEDLDAALTSFRSLSFYSIFADLITALGSFDWRTSSATDLTFEERARKGAYRGSGGYALLREHVLAHIAAASSNAETRMAATALIRAGG